MLVFVTSLWVTEATPYFVTALMIPVLVVLMDIMENSHGGEEYVAAVEKLITPPPKPQTPLFVAESRATAAARITMIECADGCSLSYCSMIEIDARDRRACSRTHPASCRENTSGEENKHSSIHFTVIVVQALLRGIHCPRPPPSPCTPPSGSLPDEFCAIP